MTEVIILGGMAVFVAGIYVGLWTADQQWIGKADHLTRKECRGKLYRVVTDND